jgi:hypothetical protein
VVRCSGRNWGQIQGRTIFLWWEAVLKIVTKLVKIVAELVKIVAEGSKLI